MSAFMPSDDLKARKALYQELGEQSFEHSAAASEFWGRLAAMFDPHIRTSEQIEVVVLKRYENRVKFVLEGDVDDQKEN